MTKLAPEWVRTIDPVIRSPARYRWTTAAAREGGREGGRDVITCYSPMLVNAHVSLEGGREGCDYMLFSNARERPRLIRGREGGM